MQTKTELSFITLTTWVQRIYFKWNRAVFHLPSILQHLIEQTTINEAKELFEQLMALVIKEYQVALKEDDLSTLSRLLNTSTVLVDGILSRGVSIDSIKHHLNALPNPRRCETDSYHKELRRAFLGIPPQNHDNHPFDFKLIELLQNLEEMYQQLDENEQQDFKLFFEKNTTTLLNLFQLLGKPMLRVFTKDFTQYKLFLNQYAYIPTGYLDFFNPFFNRLDEPSLEKLPIALIKISQQINTIGILDYCLGCLKKDETRSISINQLDIMPTFSGLRCYQQFEIVLKNSTTDLDELMLFLQQSLQLHWQHFLNHSLKVMEREFYFNSLVSSIIEEKRKCMRYNVASSVCHTFFKPQQLPRELIETIGDKLTDMDIESLEKSLKFANKTCYNAMIESQNQFKPKAQPW